ncbi:MAG: AraC family transcriptional regulator [Cyanobacteria bacterium P01_H01_bin.58]
MPSPQPISIPNAEWLTPGSPADSRLFHAAPDDRISLYPADQGYRQEIVLQDDLSLQIVDYTLRQDTFFERKASESRLTFEFRLENLGTEDSFVSPCLGGGSSFWRIPGHQRIYELEVTLKQPFMGQFCLAALERLPEHIRPMLTQVLTYFYSGGRPLHLTEAELLNHYLTNQSANKVDEAVPHPSPPAALFGKGLDFSHALRQRVTPAMQQAITQILSCPYQGLARRRYLKRKALKLLSLYLEGMTQPPLPPAELACIYEAAAILRAHMTNPPGVDQLARQVYTNRFDLYQGFHAVYGTTPLGYLHNYRTAWAYQLFHTTDWSVGQVAAAVGYSNRSRFANNFQRFCGLKPKAFQLQLQRWTR